MKTPLSAIWLGVCIILMASCSFAERDKGRLSKGSTVSGRVISIIDGDTYDLLIEGNRTLRIRMEGIDAPERGMPFYRVSRNFLSQLCYNEVVKVAITDIDDHDRYVAYSYLSDGRELGQEMIRAGLAWHFKRYNSDDILSELELEARTLKKGLWVDKDPMAPWTVRSLRRQGNSPNFNSKQ